MIQFIGKNKGLPATKMIHFVNVASPIKENEGILLKNIHFGYIMMPIHLFSRVFGLMPFRLIRNANGEVQEAQVKMIDIVWFIISICIYLYLAFVYSRLFESPSDRNESFILVLGDKLLIVLGLINGAIMVIKNMFDRFKLIEIVKNFITFDKKVAKMGTYFDYKKGKKHVMLWYIANMVISLSIALNSFFNFKTLRESGLTYDIIFFIISHNVHHFVTATVLTTYFIITYYLCIRFDNLNGLLRKHFSNQNAMQLSNNLRKLDSIAFIKSVGQQHELLTSIMDKLNSCFSIQVMLVIGGTFVISVFTLYTFYRYILEKREYFEGWFYVLLSLMLFFSIYAMMVIYIGHRITSKGKMTSEIVHAIINRCDDSEVNLSLSQLSQQVQNRHPVATCKLFNFDWPLLFSMIGAITTYLTILIQFDVSDKNTKE